MSLSDLIKVLKGGKGSGDFGHAGRPGLRGGSAGSKGSGKSESIHGYSSGDKVLLQRGASGPGDNYEEYPATIIVDEDAKKKAKMSKDYKIVKVSVENPNLDDPEVYMTLVDNIRKRPADYKEPVKKNADSDGFVKVNRGVVSKVGKLAKSTVRSDESDIIAASKKVGQDYFGKDLIWEDPAGIKVEKIKNVAQQFVEDAGAEGEIAPHEMDMNSTFEYPFVYNPKTKTASKFDAYDGSLGAAFNANDAIDFYNKNQDKLLFVYGEDGSIYAYVP